MKLVSFLAIFMFGFFTSNQSIAQSSLKTETIKVWGNCGMCKTTIEKAAKKAGAKTAAWDEDSKELKVSYAVNKSSVQKIEEEVANSGYDTQNYAAPDDVYKKLHGCCQYDRKAETAKACCDNASCGKAGDDCKAKACCKDKTCCAQ